MRCISNPISIEKAALHDEEVSERNLPKVNIRRLTFRTDNLYVISISAKTPPDGPTMAFITYGKDTRNPVYNKDEKDSMYFIMI